MKLFASLLEESLEAWQDAREGVIEEAKNIPAEKFDFKPTPEVRSVEELLEHILEVAYLMTGELTREDTDFRRAPWPELLEMYAGPARQASGKEEMIKLLHAQLEEGMEEFRRAGELAMLQLIERFDGRKGTKLAWFHHGVAQEMYHRGQLTLYQRLMGIEPALTQRIRASSE